MTLRDYLGVLRRHRWIILMCVVLVPLAAVALSLRQQRLYEATAEILISHQNLAASLGGLQQDFTEADRLAQTQASLARVPEVARRAIAAAGATGVTADGLLNNSKVSTQPNADLLDFSVTNRQPRIGGAARDRLRAIVQHLPARARFGGVRERST